ncbi:MAG: hypothetical protein R3293_25895 [Candidatus Promineifilaceae bacterium]|nr:hypothetical protein [Candidatus Promineifilaceae bacterium]
MSDETPVRVDRASVQRAYRILEENYRQYREIFALNDQTRDMIYHVKDGIFLFPPELKGQDVFDE